MKKIMYLCLMMSVMPFMSCSSDDDGGQDPIVGKWYLIEERQIENGKERNFPMTACEKMNNFDIKSDGTILSIYYFRNKDKECQKDGEETIKWTMTAKGTYTFIHIEDDGDTAEVKLEGETLTETYTYTSGGSKVQDIHVYSKTPDKSGDDEGVHQEKEDPIVGKWYLIEERHIENENEGTSPMTACEKMNTFDIKKDGTISSTYYFRNKDKECQKEELEEGEETIKWIMTAEGTYTFTYLEYGKHHHTAEVKLEGETLTEIYKITEDSRIQEINVYSKTPDKSGDDEGAY